MVGYGGWLWWSRWRKGSRLPHKGEYGGGGDTWRVLILYDLATSPLCGTCRDAYNVKSVFRRKALPKSHVDINDIIDNEYFVFHFLGDQA